MDEKGAVKLKPGETIQGYIPAVDVHEWPTDNKEAPSDGKVSDPKLIPWTESATPGKAVKPAPRGRAREIAVKRHLVDLSQNEAVHTALADGLPAPVRRSASQRYEALVQRLLQMGRENTVNGIVCWPTSLQLILDAQGVKRDGDLFVQVRTLAKHFIVKAENQQRAKDRKKSVLDWHGHYA